MFSLKTTFKPEHIPDEIREYNNLGAAISKAYSEIQRVEVSKVEISKS